MDILITIIEDYLFIHITITHILIHYYHTESTEEPQLSYDPEIGSSLNHLTAKELEERTLDTRLANHSHVAVRAVNSAFDFITKTATKIKDKYLPISEYYNYREPELRIESVNHVIDRIYEENQNIGLASVSEAFEQKLVVGSDISNKENSSIRTSLSPKDRFYAKADYTRAKAGRVAELQTKWDNQSEELRKNASFKAENIAINLLGIPNKKLSNGRELRFGENGKIAVRISGEKAGTWYDFSSDKGGDMFTLVQDVLGYDFKGSADYLRQTLGIKTDSDINSSHLQLVYDHTNSNITEKYIKEQKAKEREAKAKQIIVNKLVQSSKSIEPRSVAHRYLTLSRSITCTLGNDIKMMSIYEKDTNRHLPAVVGFARDTTGHITGGLQILLDSKTGNKANVATPKKSFGRISGSFINVGSTQDALSSAQQSVNHKITIIAEGLETALSVKQALSNDPNNNDKTFKTLCSLGISNIKNYKPYAGEKIIIAADNDGHDSITSKTIENAKVELTSYGAFVEIVRPSKDGDFNDILKDKSLGEQEIQISFNNAITRHCAATLVQYFSKNQDFKRLSQQEQENIAYISQFKTNEEKIVNAYRISSLKGNIELEVTRKSIAFADSFVCEHKYLITEANHFGAKIDNHKLVASLLDKSYAEMEVHLTAIRDKYYIIDRLDELAKDKQKAKTPGDALAALKQEQEFLAELHNNLNPSSDHDKQLLEYIQKAHELKQSNEIAKLYDSAHYAYKQKIISADDLTARFKSGHHLDIIHNDINSICHKHHCDIINDHYKKLSVGQPVIHQGQRFECILEYLEYWKNNVNHNMLPIKHINHVIERELDRQREIDQHHPGLDL